MKRLLITGALLGVLLTSCMTTKTTIGNYKEAEGKPYKYSKGKQLWLFWGFVPLGRTNVNTPEQKGFKLITRHNVSDIIITGLTFGIITSYTIKIKVKKPLNK